jgi:hypothetical protein
VKLAGRMGLIPPRSDQGIHRVGVAFDGPVVFGKSLRSDDCECFNVATWKFDKESSIRHAVRILTMATDKAVSLIRVLR